MTAVALEAEPHPVDRVLLLVNRSSGVGNSAPVVRDLSSALRRGLGGRAGLDVEVVADHPTARSTAAAFLAASHRPSAIVVAGGGGTLRAVVEAVDAHREASPGGASRIRLAALRMGSGNVVAKRLGVDADPRTAVAAIAVGLLRGTTVPVNVMRCGVGRPDGSVEQRCATTMCGLGQFGRTSGDLVRWHRRLHGPHAVAAGLVGLERLNNLEYATACVCRAVASAAHPAMCERVRVEAGGRSRELSLVAGVVMNLRVGWLPDPRVGMSDPALSLLLLPQQARVAARLETWRIDAGDRVEVELLDRESAEFFMDEDPDRFWGRLTVEAAGCIGFVPGIVPGAAWRQAA